jgi:predicted RecB family nuclease
VDKGIPVTNDRLSVGLSKSRVMAGLQCHKLLWWMVHEPEALELQADEQTQAAMARGTRVGELARGYVPGGVTVDLPYNAYDARIAATRHLLEEGAPVVYEACFRAGGVYVAVDILKRDDMGLRLIEAKSSVSVKEHHIPDVAVQAHVVQESGFDVAGTEVMHLNRACAYPNLSNLFLRSDVTCAAGALADRVRGWITAQAAMLQGPVPQVSIGPHCTSPYECPFMARCWPTLPPHHVSTLYAMRRRELELDEQGYRTIHDLPEDVPLRKIADRQRRAVQEGRIVVEPTLAQALDVFVPPIAYLDFETVGLAIPVWEGCHPYDAVPIQFSCHVQDVDGRVTHHEWLAEGPEDPRPMLAARVIEACEGAQTVVAYNAGFERRRIEQMAEALPVLAAPLRSIVARLVDLLPVIRNHVYHPDFGGSFSLKSVLPALVPELRYDDLPIRGGAMASLELERMLFQEAELTSDAKARLRADLFRYCHQDTLGLVRLLDRLRVLVRARPCR